MLGLGWEPEVTLASVEKGSPTQVPLIISLKPNFWLRQMWKMTSKAPLPDLWVHSMNSDMHMYVCFSRMEPSRWENSMASPEKTADLPKKSILSRRKPLPTLVACLSKWQKLFLMAENGKIFLNCTLFLTEVEDFFSLEYWLLAFLFCELPTWVLVHFSIRFILLIGKSINNLRF